MPEQEEQTFVDVALEDYPELVVAEPGEYQIQISDASIGTSEKTGGKYLLLRLEIPTIPNSEDFTYVNMFPSEGQTEKQRIRSANRLRETLGAFGYDYAARGGVDVQALVGLETWAYLTVENDPDYGKQNRVQEFVGQQEG